MGRRKKNNWSKKFNSKELSEDLEDGEVSSKSNQSKKSINFEKSFWWTTPEKMRLLEGLKRFGFFDIDKLADFVKTKDKNEISYFIQNRRVHLIRKRKDILGDKHSRKSIIQSWYDAASCEVNSRFKRDDSSLIFAELFSNAAKNETHLKPRRDSDPDIAAIYQYFADMLNGVISADLRPTDSTIVLSLLHSLGNIINKGNFNLEKEMYSAFKGTRDSGTLLSAFLKDDEVGSKDSKDWSKDSSNAGKNENESNQQETSEIIIDDDSNTNVATSENSNSMPIRNEIDDTNKSDENESNKFSENESNITNNDIDSNIVQFQVECNPASVPIFETETNSNAEMCNNNSQENDSDHHLWKQFQLNDPYNMKLAKGFKRVIQMFNPLHVPPFLMQIEQDTVHQFY